MAEVCLRECGGLGNVGFELRGSFESVIHFECIVVKAAINARGVLLAARPKWTERGEVRFISAEGPGKGKLASRMRKLPESAWNGRTRTALQPG